MKQKITQITRQEKETVDGRPYTRLLIKTQEHGDKLLSGFGNVDNFSWQKGDEVELVIKEVEKDGKKYLNFETPRPSTQLDRIEDEVKEIRRLIEDFIQTAP